MKTMDPIRKRSLIKEQIEMEINRKVREALDTPPAERIRRQQEEAANRRRQARENEHIKVDLNAHLNFKEARERSKLCINKYAAPKEEGQNNGAIGKLKEEEEGKLGNKFEYWLKKHYDVKKNEDGSTTGGIMMKLNDDEDGDDGEGQSRTHFRTGFEAMQNIGNLTTRERDMLFSCFTKEGFKEAVRLGRLPDGSKLEQLAGGQFRDKYGVVRDKYGPFWPRCVGPLHPTPTHKRFNPPQCQDIVQEPLVDPVTEKLDPEALFSSPLNQKYQTNTWKYMQIVYDSETSPRNQRPPHTNEKIAPCLTFESRFESGNLRQARRVGQFEYELILKNDLFTKRHTQWFYFRTHNMLKNVTYKFVILNLLKPTSLYMQGMRMLVYSDKKSHNENIGWYRTGHHIRYSRNVTRLQSPLLFREMAHFQLEFQIEFPYEDDTFYFAHCYPYNFTDLKNDISHLQNVDKSSYLTQDVLCETKIGNSCFLLIITDPEVPEDEKSPAVITARVHPGESNASWMMNGLLHFLLSNDEVAQTLRQRIVFYIVPMLNPDGVIVGNYRCSTGGRDLNRNYRNPREESFPTIYHTKKLVETLKRNYDNVILYCDLHGHSRKHNVFMYGCDSQYTNAVDFNEVKPVLNMDTIQMFVKDRIFPWLMQKQNPSMFSFNGCQFKIRRCKISTGRVVMWKQFDITDSYTLETTFSGSDQSKMHFNTGDLENVGKHLCGALHLYLESMENQKLETELSLEVLKSVLKQMVMKSRSLANALKNKSLSKQADKSEIEKEDEDENDEMKESKKLKGESDQVDEETAAAELDAFINSMTVEDVENVHGLNISLDDIEEASSSDSDSESEPEEIVEEPEPKQIKLRKKKKRRQTFAKDPHDTPNRKSIFKRASTKYLPTIAQSDKSPIKTATDKRCSIICDNDTVLPKSDHIKLPLFVSKYDGRTNGGIPCFSEERLMERARRKSLASIKAEIEKAFWRNNYSNSSTIQVPVEIPEHVLQQYQYHYQLFCQNPLLNEVMHPSYHPVDVDSDFEFQDERIPHLSNEQKQSAAPSLPPKPVIRLDVMRANQSTQNIAQSRRLSLSNNNGNAYSTKYASKLRTTIYSDGPSVTVKQTMFHEG